MSYKEDLLSQLKDRDHVTYEELNRLLPSGIISEEEVEEVLEFLAQNHIRTLTSREINAKSRNKFRNRMDIGDFLDTPDKFYFYELNKTLQRNIPREKAWLVKLTAMKKEITGLLVPTDFFCYQLNRAITRGKRRPERIFTDRDGIGNNIRRFRELFRDYSLSADKENSVHRQPLTDFLHTLGFRFKYILTLIGDLKKNFILLKEMDGRPHTPADGELFGKKQKIGLELSGFLISRLDEHLEKYNSMKNNLVLSFAPVILSLAKHYYNGKLSFNDLIQEANLALINAVDQYDPVLHRDDFYAFSTQVTKTELKKFIHTQSLIRSTKGVEKDKKLFLKTVEKLTADLSRKPTAREVQTVLQWDEEKLVRTTDLMKSADSLDRAGEEEDTTLMDAIVDRSMPEPEEQAIENIFKEKTRELLKMLKENEQTIIRMRFGFNDMNKVYSYKEIAETLQMPENIVMNIEEHSLKKLRIIFKKNNMEGFL
ncbi:MAG: sigma-70 family RNA polymerase sigma factor [bacterium]|nr:sigma-70 family RNA polymerase sigma factor [bacterium]